MRKLILVVHTSLDGFVAGTKGELDDFDAGDENLEFVGKLTEDADTALFGRTSYQLLESYWPTANSRPHATKAEIAYSNWYNHAQRIVVSTTMQKVNSKNLVIINENVPNEIIKIKEMSGKNILLFGSPTLSQLLMTLNLIDSYWVFVNPILFGKGIPLFGGRYEKIKLRLVTTTQFANGELGLNYTANRF